MIVTMIRHGATIWQPEGRYQGCSDVPLSDEGIQALQPAEERPYRVLVTKLQRTQQTAARVFPGVEQIITEGLEEMDFGAFEGKNYRELDGDPDYQSWIDGMCTSGIHGGESREQFCSRVCGAFDAWMRKYAGEKSMTIVAHGGTLMAVLERYGRPEREYFDWQVPCGTGFRMLAEDWERDPVLKVLEPVSYL